MNELDLENELRALRPAAPSRGLEERIARDLALGSRREVVAPVPRKVEHEPGFLMAWLDRLLWTGLGAAAAAVAMVMVSQKPGVPQAEVKDTESVAVTSLQPLLATEEDLGWRDEGVHFDENGRPMLKVRRMTVERQAWADLQHAGVVQTEQPRQEVMWIPVSLH